MIVSILHTRCSNIHKDSQRCFWWSWKDCKVGMRGRREPRPNIRLVQKWRWEQGIPPPPSQSIKLKILNNPFPGSWPEQLPVSEPQCEQCWSVHLQSHCGGVQGDQNIRQVNNISPQNSPLITALLFTVSYLVRSRHLYWQGRLRLRLLLKRLDSNLI